MWRHATCPICNHANAVIDGVCRDCGAKSPQLLGVYEWLCDHCKGEFTETQTWAVKSDDGRYVSGCLQTTSDLADADLFPRPDAERYAASLHRTEERLARLGHAPHTWTAILVSTGIP